MSCPYQDLFGKVGTGVHSYRIFDVAIVDVTLTILAAYLLYLFVFPKSGFWVVLCGLFLLGIVLHHLFCVQTTIDKFLFG